MGWNCTIAVVHAAAVADLSALGWTPTSDTLSWEEVTSLDLEGVAALERPGGLVLASGGVELVDAVEPLAALGTVHLGLFQSVTDTYFWEVARPHGRRSWRWSAYEEIESSGPPHPAEEGVERLDEDTLFGLLDAVGLTVDEQLEEASYVVLATGGGADITPVPRRRKRFGIF